MCLPMAAPMLAALTFASGAVSTLMSYQSAKAQAKGQDAQNEQTRKALALEESLAQMDIARQRQQEYENAASEANSYAADMRREQSEVDALLGEAFAGNSGDPRTATMGIWQGQDMATLTSNASRVQSELGYASSAESNSARQKMASLRPADHPSKFGAALTLAGHGLTYAKTMSDLKASPRG